MLTFIVLLGYIPSYWIFSPLQPWGHRGRDHMVVGFTAIYNIGIKLLDSVCIEKPNVLLFYSLILVKDCE